MNEQKQENRKEKLNTHYMKSGKYKGKKIDNRTRRSLSIVSETDDYFIVDYFFHKGIFYTAKIPKNCVSKIMGQRFSFGPLVNHAQVRIILDIDYFVELYPLGDYSNSESLFKLNDIVYTIEVVGPRGTAWTLSKAFGTFVSAHRLISIEEVVFERLTLGHYQVIQSPPLLLKKEHLNKALEMMIKRGNKAEMTEKYYLFTFWFGANNCTSEVFKILDSLLSPSYTFFEKLISKIFWRFPFALRSYLRFRGAIDNSIIVPTLNEEFEKLAKSEEYLTRLNFIKKQKK